MVELSPLRQLRLGQLPKMVSWYDPRLLARIGVRTIISSVFGQYADQRLIQAVTDPCPTTRTCAPATTTAIPTPADPNRRIAADENGAFWLDYVADVGDGFESTYTIGLPARPGQPRRPRAGRLRHGEVLIMGGDQCYPQATREEYKKRLLAALQLGVHGARTRTASCSRIPGNHDWYDGLDSPSTACSAPRATSCPTPRAT